MALFLKLANVEVDALLWSTDYSVEIILREKTRTDTGGGHSLGQCLQPLTAGGLQMSLQTLVKHY